MCHQRSRIPVWGRAVWANVWVVRPTASAPKSKLKDSDVGKAHGTACLLLRTAGTRVGLLGGIMKGKAGSV